MTGSAPLRQRLAAGERLDGIVVRTPSHHVLEVLAAPSPASRPDVVMLDGEHAPIGGAMLDVMLAVATARDLACLVRVPELSRAAIQAALDLGATGVVVPHVDSPAAAAQCVRFAHYGEGGRGYSGSTRAAGWGQRSMETVLAQAAASTAVVIQVEDAAALAVADEIVGVPGVDAVLIGAADLAVSLGATSTTAATVVDACARVASACTSAGTAVAAVATSPDDAERWRSLGVTLVFHGTDQSRISGAGSPVPLRSDLSARSGSPS